MSNTALILLDLQQGIVNRFDSEEYLSRVAQSLKAAREAKIHIIHVRTAFRPGHAEVSSRNFSAQKIAQIGGAVEGDPSVEIASEVAPIAGESLVTKRRVSAFSGSDIECLLRGLEVTHIVIGGLATSGAVLSTVRQAADLDFDVTIIEDLCWDSDQEVHKVLMEKVFSRQAHVISSQKWIESIGPAVEKYSR
jgi:nicotinamidase-related amidase